MLLRNVRLSSKYTKSYHSGRAVYVVEAVYCDVTHCRWGKTANSHSGSVQLETQP
jgi:hypothetical protein